MELLTVKETAEMLKLSPLTVRRYITAGRLKAVRIGGRVRVSREAVESIVQLVVEPPRDEDRAIAEWKPLTPNDSLRNIVGLAKGEGPTDIARNKHHYLTEAYEDKHL
jgi:excisionase family DNA binding protein